MEPLSRVRGEGGGGESVLQVEGNNFITAVRLTQCMLTAKVNGTQPKPITLIVSHVLYFLAGEDQGGQQHCG